MQKLTTTILLAALVFSGAVAADDKKRHKKHKKHDYQAYHADYEYAKVVRVRPIYREVEFSRPVRECWQEPVYHTDNDHHGSAGGMLAGGLIGGIIGHEIGKGRNKRIATAMGTLIGAQIGQQAAARGHKHRKPELAGYEEHCNTRHQVDYEEVVDGYDVTYRFRGKRYRVEMPYDPGKRIKMRIEFSPVI